MMLSSWKGNGPLPARVFATCLALVLPALAWGAATGVASAGVCGGLVPDWALAAMSAAARASRHCGSLSPPGAIRAWAMPLPSSGRR